MARNQIRRTVTTSDPAPSPVYRLPSPHPEVRERLTKMAAGYFVMGKKLSAA